MIYDVFKTSRERGDFWLGWVDADSEAIAQELARKVADERDEPLTQHEWIEVRPTEEGTQYEQLDEYA